MQKGKYFIGDPCYIFDKSWKRILNHTNYFADGRNSLFGYDACYGDTAYGDGVYHDNFNRLYTVDSGTLAILPTKLISWDNKVTESYIEESRIMHIVEMSEDFLCEVFNGVFKFGDIEINTRFQA